jgi:branched-chain amino acid transport system permease protein
MQVFVQTLVGGLGFGAIYALVAMGFSIVYRTMGLVNFAHGDVVMTGAFIAATFFMTSRLPFIVAALLAITVTAVIGLVIERALRPLETRDLDLMLIGTIGFGIVLEAIATLIWGATGRAVPIPLGAQPVKAGGIYLQPYDLLMIGITAAAALGVWFLLSRTKTGAAMQAVAADYEAGAAMPWRSRSAPGWPHWPVPWPGRSSTSMRAWAQASASAVSPPRSSAGSGTSVAPSSAGSLSGCCPASQPACSTVTQT